ncbi:8-amino-7-oxononanoate synthase [Paenibacillus sp. GSMTC-2017]|nr:8-amino-7-oxononanoate synthase [Paenibacillus sp. GSMTC-2017]
MDWMKRELDGLANCSLERSLRNSAPVALHPSYIIRGQQQLLNLASNDYLGLSQHPLIIEAMSKSLSIVGAGAGASRLVTGNYPLFEHLEVELAAWHEREAALVFANGYMANSGIIRTLVGRGDVVFSDQLNHASIVDGIVLSRADHARYRHNDMKHLETLLEKYRHKERKLIVTDAIFSMDGDQAPLQELIALKREYGALLMVDEAHSSGIYSERGEGLCHALGIHHDVDIMMGTFSKSFGLYGAYVCGSRTLVRWLVNKARPLIYSTALPPSIIAGILASLSLVQSEHWRRQQLNANSVLFRSFLREGGYVIGEGDSPIIPLIIGDNDKALRFSEALEEKGIAAVAIRPPTVPEGTARIRFSLSAVHGQQELAEAAETIIEIGQQLEVLKR